MARWLAGLFAILLVAMSFAKPAYAAAPPAGASISNQASASYSDGSGIARTVTSNQVLTTVTQVYALSLTVNGAQSATPGSIVYYPHTLTNTGNGTDSFSLVPTNNAAQAFNLTGLQVYLDNGSGAPTGPAITATPLLTAGSTFKFIVQGTVPSNATNGQTNAITVTATSAGSAAATATNTDTTTVTSNAVIQLTKGISASSGVAGAATNYTYTITYTNTGNSAAGSVRISDPLPAGMTYQTGTARWSVTGAGTALSETGGVSGTAPNTVTSTFTLASNTIAFNVANVAAGQSGQLSFQVRVAAGTAPGVLNNTASVIYNNNGSTGTDVNGSSNAVPFTVLQTAAVLLTPPATIATADPGTTISFTNVVTNQGNGTDSFNISLSGSTYPAGTTFQLYKSDGVTPMSDSNTGPIAPNGTYNVILKVTLPPNASGNNGGAGYSVTKTATSVYDATKTSSGSDRLTTVTSAAVDLTNNTITGTGQGVFAGGEGAAQQTNTTNPGTTTVFTLVARNTGPTPDTYDLGASTAGNFSTGLPSGWSVVFRADGGAGNCSTTGASITNTGTVAANGNVVVCAAVTVPAGFAAGTNDIYFRAKSPTSVAGDVLHDAVTVNAVRLLSLSPNGAGQTYPGGSYVYAHTLRNSGNVTEGGGAGATLSTLAPTINNGGTNWTSAFYIDSNNNGTLDAADVLITGNLNDVLTGNVLAAGQSVNVFVKVIAPSGAVAGTVNATTLTITTTNGAAPGGYITTVPAPVVVTDSTSVIAGNLTLSKQQMLDATCATTAATFPAANSVSWTTGNLSARPGQCVLYQITVTNVGAADATGVVVSDSTPTHTTISVAPATALPGRVNTLAVGATGTITANIGTGATVSAGGTLSAGQSAVITFGVKVNE